MLRAEPSRPVPPRILPLTPNFPRPRFPFLLLATHGVQPPPARDVATDFHPNPLVASFHSYS